MMHPIGSGQTDIGRKRESNEDCLLIDNELGLYIVSDGMGGHAAGEAAAEAAIAAVERAIRDERARVHRVRSGLIDAENLEILLADAVRGACREVYNLAISKPELAGMGCTLTALVIAGGKAAMAHVGDTRLYLWRGGQLHQLSTDHTMVEDLVKVGAVSREAVRNHPFANTLTRAIGSQESVRVDTLLFDVLPDDRFLLCSDGLSYYFEDSSDLSLRIGHSDIETVPEELVDYANEAGGRDNVTALVVGVEIDPAEQHMALALASDIEIKIDVLGTVFLFEDLTFSQLAKILALSQIQDFEADETVLEQNEPSDTLIVVLEGSLNLKRDGLQMGVLVAGDHVGETTLLRRRPTRASLVANESSRLLILKGETFRTLARSRPWLGVALFERLGRRLSFVADRQREVGERSEKDGEIVAEEIF